MSRSKKTMLVIGLLIIASMLLAACQPAAEAPAENAEVEETPQVVEVEEEEEPMEEEVVLPDTIVICIGQEPDSLYMYGTDMLASAQVLEAIYDGGAGVADGAWDDRSFGYQAVLIEKMPSLADGDAVINAVTVAEGATVADVDGNPATLEAGLTVKPAGCNSTECAVEYEGGELEVDQMVVTFSLLPGLMWSDGTPLTAADSVYSFNLNMDPDTPESKFTGDRTATYEALDDTTLVWTGLPGYLDSTYFTNIWTPAPEHIWGSFTALELVDAEESARSPIGYGPYVLDDWVAGESLTLSKNPNYHRAGEGLPYFDTLVYRVVGEDSNANIAAIISGECDIVDQTSHLDDQIPYLLELQNAGEVNATLVTGTVWEHADFAIKPVSYDDGYDQAEDRPDFFGDVRTRQAIAMCMDRQAVVDTVMYGQSIVLDTYLPPQHPLFNSDVTSYAFDVAAGSALLEEVGWVDGDGDGVREAAGVEGIEDGTPLEFLYYTTNAEQRQKATQILAQTMAECGIKVNLEYWVPSEYFADGPEGPVFGRRYDIGQFAWLTGVEPPCDLYISDQIVGPSGESPEWDLNSPAFCGWGCSNNTGFSDAEFDAVCKAAITALPGQPAYDENHLEAQQIFSDKLPVVPLYLRLKLAATRPDMCGFVMDPTANSEMWNVEEFGYGALCQ